MKWLFLLNEDFCCDLNEIYKDDDPNLVNKIKQEIQEDVHFYSQNTPEEEAARLMTITKDAKIIVYKGYTWDGNSPKFNFFDLFWLGTPDGLIVENIPITYHASLIHDILGQFKYDRHMPSVFKTTGTPPDLWFSQGRLGRDGLYFQILKQKEFFWRHIYYLAVALAGPLYDAFLAKVKHVDFEHKGTDTDLDPSQRSARA